MAGGGCGTGADEALWPAQLPEDHPIIAAQREDMTALAVTLLEVVSVQAFCCTGPSCPIIPWPWQVGTQLRRRCCT